MNDGAAESSLSHGLVSPHFHSDNKSNGEIFWRRRLFVVVGVGLFNGIFSVLPSPLPPAPPPGEKESREASPPFRVSGCRFETRRCGGKEDGAQCRGKYNKV